ncbi:MAG: peptidase C14 [Cyanobacteria bacterium QS_8_48_54]|nr:MAG: peptidase C14 [Cyanobacteria bacterium QS_8_48_54]
MELDRRTFLQKAGVVLLALGGSETVLSILGIDRATAVEVKRYAQTLAQPHPRKLALLVGINQYPQSANLKGCITDVERQRELLIYRFGFHPDDVYTITDASATREKIETAFVEHLIKQAGEEDVVVFHYSGYGSRIKIPHSSHAAQSSETETGNHRLTNSLVPVDGISEAKNEVSEETLMLLARSLATDKVTMVLDTSHTRTGQILQGNLQVRSCPKSPAELPASEERASQEALLQRIHTSQKRNKQIPGTVLAAAGEDQPATEVQWRGFSAGLFTYALTQSLWETTPASTVQISLMQTSQAIEHFMGTQQQPQLQGESNGKQPLFTYHLMPHNPGADGVVTAVEENSKTVELKLTGLPATVLEYYGDNSRFTLFSEESGSVGEQRSAGVEEKDDAGTRGRGDAGSIRVKGTKLRIASRKGLTAKAQLAEQTASEDFQLHPGQLVQESIRVLPRNPGLVVALDASLGKIERVDATSAFSNSAAVSSVVSAGKQSADCLFGKVKEVQAASVAANLQPDTSSSQKSKLPSPEGYGLFSVGSVPIPSTAVANDEAVKSAVERLVPELTTMLAAKLWRLTENEGSSCLGMRATLETVAPQYKEAIRRETLRALPDNSFDRIQLPLSHFYEQVPRVSVGSQIRYRLENYSARPLYVMLLGIDSGGNAITLYSPRTASKSNTSTGTATQQDTRIAPGETRLFPDPSTSFDWIVPGPAGIAEIYLFGSTAPFTKTLKALSAAPQPKGEGERVVDLVSPLKVAQALQKDLQAAHAISSDTIDSGSDAVVLDVNTWATLGFVYQVV